MVFQNKDSLRPLVIRIRKKGENYKLEVTWLIKQREINLPMKEDLVNL